MPVQKPDEEIRMGFDARALRRGLAGAKNRIGGFLFSVKGLVAAAGVAMAAVAVRAFATQEQAEKKLRRALAATGQYSRETEARLRKVATEIQGATKLGDEQALSMMANLIQVGRVAPEEAGKAAKTIAAIAEQTGRPIQRVARSFAEQLAQANAFGTKTLGEIEKNFDNETVQRIRNLKAAGKQAEVTTALVDAMNEKFKGGADVVKGSTDEWTQLGNLWGDLVEVAGGIIHELLSGLIPAIKSVLNWMIKGGQTVQAFAFLAKGNIEDIQKYFQLLGLKIQLYLLVALDTVETKFSWFVDSVKYGLELLSGGIDTLKKRFWQFVDLVVVGFKYVDESIDNAAKRIEESDKPLTKTQKRIVALRGEIDSLTESLDKNKTSWSEAWERANKDTEAVLDERRASVSKVPTGADMADAGAGGPEPAAAAGKDLSKYQDDIELYKAMLAGLKDAELVHKREMLSIAREREQAQKIILAEGNMEEARLLQERADLRAALADEALQKAREAAAVQAAEDAEKMALALEAREVAKELGLSQAAEDLEFLQQRLQAEREAKAEARGQEIADRLAAHRREQADEAKHGKTMAKILKAGRSAEFKNASGFLDTMAKLNVGGSKKMQKIQEAAERARLVLMMATKPFEAYVETSSRYPWPLGPALGALHAVAVAAQIGTALRAVGGGGGGSAPGGGIGGAPAEDTSAPAPAEDGQDGGTESGAEERTLPPINLTVNLEADGYSLAKLVEQHIAQAEDR